MNDNGFTRFFNKKNFLLLSVVLVILLLVLVALNLSQNKQSPTSSEQSQDTNITQTAQPTQTAQSQEIQKAINEQLQVDKDYSNWQKDLSAVYPWIKKLPLTSNKYYVYFNLETKVFVGRLYPNPGDNVEQLKSDILKLLKDSKGVPVDNFKFAWEVYPT